MFRRIYKPNLTTDLSKLRIIKNLIVASVSFFILKTGDEGILMLQTTMNKKEGLGTISVAVMYVSYGLTSLLFSSFLIKKFGTKNSLLLSVITCLPYIASNFYPHWITMVPSATLRGFGNSMLWASQCTYFNECSVLFCKTKEKGRKCKQASNIVPKYDNFEGDKDIKTLKSDEHKVESLSAFDLLGKADIDLPISNSNRTVYLVDSSLVTLTAYRQEKYGSFENKLVSEVKNAETAKDTKDHNLKMFTDTALSKKLNNASDEGKEELFLDVDHEDIRESERISEHQSYVDSTKAFFFGILGLAYNSAIMLSNLISYYILNIGDKLDYNKTSSTICGAGFCSTTKEGFNDSIDDVTDDTRYLLTGVSTVFGIAAPLLILFFLDRMIKATNDVKLSWDNFFAAIKYIKKKDQLLIIPFTVGSSICRAFYMADFTKAYIACAWSVSQIGLITVIYGATSALSSLLSGVTIKHVGRSSVMILYHVITIANFVSLLFWNPNPQQPYMLYLQSVIFGLISGIFDSQTKAFYGILFEGDEEPAFSSYNVYSSIGWFLPFIYNDFFCVSVKIYIVLGFSCTGLLGYLLAERSYSLRNKRTDSSK